MLQFHDLWEMPKHLEETLGRKSCLVDWDELNFLISSVEHFPEFPKDYQNHPIVFKSTMEKDCPVCKVGYDKKGNVVFKVGNKIVFRIIEESWINVNFDDLQENLFRWYDPQSDIPEHYKLLPGTYSGKII